MSNDKKDWERRREGDKAKAARPEPQNEYTHETVKLMPSVWIWFIVIFILGAAGTTASLALKPVWMGFEREIVQRSPQYVESKRTLLNGLVQDWTRLEAQITESTDEAAAANR